MFRFRFNDKILEFLSRPSSNLVKLIKSSFPIKLAIMPAVASEALLREKKTGKKCCSHLG